MSALSELPSPTLKPKWWRPFSRPLHQASPLDPYGASIPFAAPSSPEAPMHALHSGRDKLMAKGRSVPPPPPVFGAPLEDSSKVASVAISMIGADKRPYIYGFIPVVVAKCGLYLKENATMTEGIFRISGSTKRMRELQAVFDTAPLYGKELDWRWTGPSSPLEGADTNAKPYYSVHDAANVLRRFLLSLPEPLIPYTMYKDFRAVLTKHADISRQVQHFRALISTLPDRSQYLLLYLLDLLAVFARKAGSNLMTASNLAVVFQPGLCSPPPLRTPKPGAPPPAKEAQEAIVKEVKDAQQVLEFLIENQHAFVMSLAPNSKPVPATSPTEQGTTSSKGSISSSGPAAAPTVGSTFSTTTNPTTSSNSGTVNSIQPAPARQVRVVAPPSVSSDDDALPTLTSRGHTDLSRRASERSEHSRRRKIKKERKENVANPLGGKSDVESGAASGGGQEGTPASSASGGYTKLKRSRTLPLGQRRNGEPKSGSVGSSVPLAQQSGSLNLSKSGPLTPVDERDPDPQPSRRYQTNSPNHIEVPSPRLPTLLSSPQSQTALPVPATTSASTSPQSNGPTTTPLHPKTTQSPSPSRRDKFKLPTLGGLMGVHAMTVNTNLDLIGLRRRSHDEDRSSRPKISKDGGKHDGNGKLTKSNVSRNLTEVKIATVSGSTGLLSLPTARQASKSLDLQR